MQTMAFRWLTPIDHNVRLFLGALLLFVPHLRAASEESLKMEVFFDKIVVADYGPDAEGLGNVKITLFVRLRNIGENPLVVARSKLYSTLPEYGTSQKGDQTPRLSLLYYVGSGNMMTGEPNIPSASELSLVTLKAGEATEIKIRMRVDDGFDEKNIRFTYVIEKSVAQRYGTWNGKISAIALPRSAAPKAKR